MLSAEGECTHKGYDTGRKLIDDSLFGFLTGAVVSGAGMYYYVFDEYRISNSLLTEDIYVSFDPFLGRWWGVERGLRCVSAHTSDAAGDSTV